jgi:hypothetical protein
VRCTVVDHALGVHAFQVSGEFQHVRRSADSSLRGAAVRAERRVCLAKRAFLSAVTRAQGGSISCLPFESCADKMSAPARIQYSPQGQR